MRPTRRCFFFFFNDTATTEIYTLSLHDALPISSTAPRRPSTRARISTSPRSWLGCSRLPTRPESSSPRSEEHTSELQSRLHLVCRLLLEKKKKKKSLQATVPSYQTCNNDSLLLG